MSAAIYRRLAGLVFGAVLGLTYGLVSQTINRIALPGIPLYQPPLGLAGNVALALLSGAALGVIAAWPEEGVIGTAIASALSAVVIVGGSLLQARLTGNQLIVMLVNLIFLVLPLWGLLAPVIAALRWGVNKLVEGQRDRLPVSRRLPTPVVLVLAVGVAGALSLHRPEARFVLSQTHALLQAGQRADNPRALPEPLAGPDAGHFIERGKAAYTLAWETRGIDKYRIPRPGRNFDSHAVVVARFRGGWNLVCLYVTPDEAPLCKGFEELP